MERGADLVVVRGQGVDVSGTSVIVEVPVCKVVANPWQVRQLDADLVGELTTAMRENGFRGVLVGRAIWVNGPVVISEAEHLEDIRTDLDCGNALIQLAWGHHRLEAATAAGIEEVPVELVGGLSDEQMASWALMENVRRKDISPIEEAQAIQRLTKEFKWAQARVAEMLGYKDAATVSNKLRLLRLPEEIQAKVSGGHLSERAARSLVTVAELNPKRAKELAEQDRVVTDYDVKQAKRHASKPLTEGWDKAPWPMEWVPAALDVEGDGSAISCQGCEHHLQIEAGGDEVRCSKPACWNKRRRVWEAQVMAAESVKQGIPAVVQGVDDVKKFGWEDRIVLGDRCTKQEGQGRPCAWLRLCYRDGEVEACCGCKAEYERCMAEAEQQKKVRKATREKDVEEVRGLLLGAATMLAMSLLPMHLEIARALNRFLGSAMFWGEPEELDVHTKLAWKVLTQEVEGLPRWTESFSVADVKDGIEVAMGKFGLDWSGLTGGEIPGTMGETE